MSQLLDAPIDTRVKLCALWTSTMLCSVYAEHFELYIPGRVVGISQGKLWPFGSATQELLLAATISVAIPALMIFLSVALPAQSNRWLNLVIGVLFVVLTTATAFQAHWYFYMTFNAIEAVLAALVVWYAWKWPVTQSSV